MEVEDDLSPYPTDRQLRSIEEEEDEFDDLDDYRISSKYYTSYLYIYSFSNPA